MPGISREGDGGGVWCMVAEKRMWCPVADVDVRKVRRGGEWWMTRRLFWVLMAMLCSFVTVCPHDNSYDPLDV